MGLRERLMGMGRSPGPVSQFEGFRNREGMGAPLNPFAGLQQATAPMATAGMASLNGAPTTTAPAGGAGGGGASALSTGAPIGTMAHDGGGGPFTFGFPFGIDESGGWEPSEAPDAWDEGGGTSGEEAGGGASSEDMGGDTSEDTGGGDADEGGDGDDDGGGGED